MTARPVILTMVVFIRLGLKSDRLISMPGRWKGQGLWTKKDKTFHKLWKRIPKKAQPTRIKGGSKCLGKKWCIRLS